MPKMWQTKSFCQNVPDKSSYQSTGPQATTKTTPSSVNHVASEPDKPDSSSDDEYLYVMSQNTSASKISTDV